MSTEINNVATSSLQASKKEHLDELKTKYEASKETLKNKKALKEKYSNIYAQARQKYGENDPAAVNKARYQFESANSSFRSADFENDWLNHSLFDAILDYGRFGYNL